MLQIGRKLGKWSSVIIWRHEIIAKFFDDIVFFFSSLKSDPIFMSISFLDLESIQLLFRRGLNGTRETENTPGIWYLSNI